MKSKKHHFVVTVECEEGRDVRNGAAEYAILCAFACRQPDGLKFTTTNYATFKNRESRKRRHSRSAFGVDWNHPVVDRASRGMRT